VGGFAGGRIMIGAAVATVIGLFVFFMHQATTHPPETAETRIELPNAFTQDAVTP
jgi:hypothetical protein